ncbi:hypothetical protein S83_054290 [Arachis hypogaea]
MFTFSVFVDVYSSSNSTRPKQQRWDDASTGFRAATHVDDVDSCRSQMFGRVRSDGDSSGEDVGTRRWSATVPVGRNRSYTSQKQSDRTQVAAHTAGRRRKRIFPRNKQLDFLEGR